MDIAIDAGGRDVPLTQEELGQLLGKSRHSIAMLLHGWEQNGLIKTKYGHISIHGAESLGQIAYPDARVRASRGSGHNKEIT